MDENELTKVVENVKVELALLRKRIEELESNTRYSQPSLPDTWLLSHSFLKRAFGVFGHYLVGGLIVALVVGAILFGCALLFSLAGISIMQF